MESSNDVATKTVILADDEPYILAAYKEALELEGFQVYPVHDGQEALDSLAKFVPDLLVLDLIMPNVSGFEVIKKLKSSHKLKNVPVIVLTNLGQTSDEEEVRSLGIDEYIIKADTSIGEFIQRVMQVLSK